MSFNEQDFVAGAACLDFVNTVGGHRDGEADDKLTDYAALVAWADAGALLPDKSCRRVRNLGREGRAAVHVHHRALALREALYYVFTASREGRRPETGDVEILNRELAAAYGQRSLRHVAGEWSLDWKEEGDALDAPLWPVIDSAVLLLQSEEIARLRECASNTCGWLFLDLSKNGSRRWCDMRVCGNRAKARRYRSCFTAVRSYCDLFLIGGREASRNPKRKAFPIEWRRYKSGCVFLSR